MQTWPQTPDLGATYLQIHLLHHLYNAQAAYTIVHPHENVASAYTRQDTLPYPTLLLSFKKNAILLRRHAMFPLCACLLIEKRPCISHCSTARLAPGITLYERTTTMTAILTAQTLRIAPPRNGSQQLSGSTYAKPPTYSPARPPRPLPPAPAQPRAWRVSCWTRVRHRQAARPALARPRPPPSG